jgi:predicted glycosyltransferase
MTVEAAVLGTPSLRYSSFVGRISCLEELEERYQLTRGFRPGQEEQLLAALRELLAARELEETWRKRRQAMLADKCNLTQWLIDFFEGLCSRRHR